MVVWKIDKKEVMMVIRLLGKVGQVALRVVEANEGYYDIGLLKIIPEEILGLDLTDENLHSTGLMIDELRFQKEAELAGSLGFDYRKMTPKQRERLSALINCDIKNPIEGQEKMVWEINFLFNVAATVSHQ
ncbi:MAG: hypothetical protein ABIG29_02200 [Candidatus Nealsonbacteria bacterium]